MFTEMSEQQGSACLSGGESDQEEGWDGLGSIYR